jgi:16S rRNA (guanine(966)-N(2))-methyltransferase RsmD
MRVIAGTAKGRRLRALRGQAVRPTADRVKEALFSILQSRFDLEGAVLLDLFAGTGALGIEALSRGAERVVFIEQDHAARRVLGSNLVACGLGERSEVIGVAVRRALADLEASGRCFDGVFMDPPYSRDLAASALTQLGAARLVAPGGWVVVEHHVDDGLADAYGPLRLTAARRYGKTALTVFSSARMVDE